MRPLVIKDKYVGKSKIESFKDFSLEDNYSIKEQDDGFLVDGKVIIRGNLSYGSEVEELYKEIDVNILIPFEKLESRNMIKLVLDKADFDKNDNILIIKLKIKIIGEDELKEKLIMGNQRKMEYPPKEVAQEVNQEVNEDVKLDDDFLKSMEEMIKGSGKDVEIVSTMNNELNQYDTNEINNNEKDISDNDIFEVRVDESEPAIEDKKEVEDMPVPLPLIKDEHPVDTLEEDKEKYNESNTKNNNENQKEELTNNKKEELLKTEYVKTFFFHRVKNNENLEDILNNFNMTLDDFKKLNKKTDIKENDLIQIKIK